MLGPVGLSGLYARRGEAQAAGAASAKGVPVCLSSSHIAYGSIRMEPVFMVLGQSAAAAACQAIDAHATVQTVDVPKLQAQLLAEKQILEWKGKAGGK